MLESIYNLVLNYFHYDVSTMKRSIYDINLDLLYLLDKN